MKKINGMRPQDIPVILQLHIMPGKNWLFADIAVALKISPSEVSESLERCRLAKLVDTGKRSIMASAVWEFLVYGLKYVWPAELGKKVRGIPTAHSAKPLSEIIVPGNEVYVWPFKNGIVRGESIQPLYHTIPQVVLHNPELYEMLSLVDAIRIGKSREIQIAKDELKKRLFSL